MACGDCPEDDTPGCDAFEEVESAVLPVVEDEEGCRKTLTGSGLMSSEDGELAMKDGSDAKPLNLPDLSELPGETWPRIVIQNDAGRLFYLRASAESERKLIHSRDGSFTLEPFKMEACFPYGVICTNCESDDIAAWKVNEDGSRCLISIPKDSLIDFENAWTNSNTVNIEGDGSEASPRSAHVRVSALAGNIIEVKDDGLYVACCTDYGDEDPVDEL